MFGLLAMCVSSGPTFPAAGVPLTVWQPTHALARNVSWPALVFGSFNRFASAIAVLAQVAYSFCGWATIVMGMSACPSPQNSEHWPLYVPAGAACNQRLARCP